MGNFYGINDCSGGCDKLNGYCFALKFYTDATYTTAKSPYPYMIFQSVNIAANVNSFDIYMPGGGCGAFCNAPDDYCAQFWGAGDWSTPGAVTSVSSLSHRYSVTYDNGTDTTTYYGDETFNNAATWINTDSNFPVANYYVAAIPVTCPSALTQVSGIALDESVTTIGNQALTTLTSLTDADFSSSAAIQVSTTSMQDCKTPSSGYCGKDSTTVSNYDAYISASTTEPLLVGSADGEYCSQNPSVSGYCSWDDGSTAGSDYCNTDKSTCLGCGNSPKWCTCPDGTCSSSFSGMEAMFSPIPSP
jgi:hypothetical protein